MALDLQFPREPRRGEPLDADWGVAVVRTLRTLALMPGVGYLIRRNLLGTALEITGGAGGSSRILRTLFVSNASSGGTAQVVVSVGRIANLPVKIDGTELGATPGPKLPITETGVIFVKGTFDEDGDPTAFEILAAAEVPDDTETEGYKILAEVDLGDGGITRLDPVTWNLSEVQKCGPTTYLWGGIPEA